MIEFTRHAFAGIDKDAKTLDLLMGQMKERTLTLLDLFIESLSSSENIYAEAKEIDRQNNYDEIAIDLIVAQMLSKYSMHGAELRYLIIIPKISYLFERVADKVKNSIKRSSRMDYAIPEELKITLAEIVAAIKDIINASPDILTNYSDEKLDNIKELKKIAVEKYRLAKTQLRQDNSIPNSDILFILKNFERISDQILDLAKISFFIAHGKKYQP